MSGSEISARRQASKQHINKWDIGKHVNFRPRTGSRAHSTTMMVLTPLARLTARRCAATVIRPRHNELWRISALVGGASFATSSRPYNFVKMADRFEPLLSTNEAEMLCDEEVGTILALNRSQFDDLIEALAVGRRSWRCSWRRCQSSSSLCVDQ